MSNISSDKRGLYASKGAVFWFCFIVVSLVTLGRMLSDMYVPSLPEIGRDLVASSSQVKITVSCYLFGIVLPQLFFGSLSDAIGRKKIILFGLSLVMLGTVCCYFSKTLVLLYVGRLLQGFGVGGITPCSRAILIDLFSGKRLLRLFSLVALVSSTAPAISPIIGAVLASHFGWRSVFLVLFLFTGFMLFVVAFFTPETLPSENKKPFTLQQLLVDSFSLFRIRSFIIATLVSGYAYAILMSYYTMSPHLIQVSMGYNRITYSWASATLVFSLAIARLLNVFLVTRYTLLGICRLGVSLLLLSTVVFFLVSLLQRPSLWLLIMLVFFVLFSVGMIFGNIFVMALQDCSHISATASALFSLIQVSIAGLVCFIAAHLPDERSLYMAGVFIVLSLFTSYTLGIMGKPLGADSV